MWTSLSLLLNVAPVSGQVKYTPDTERQAGSFTGSLDPWTENKYNGLIERQLDLLSLLEGHSPITLIIKLLCLLCFRSTSPEGFSQLPYIVSFTPLSNVLSESLKYHSLKGNKQEQNRFLQLSVSISLVTEPQTRDFQLDAIHRCS